MELHKKLTPTYTLAMTAEEYDAVKTLLSEKSLRVFAADTLEICSDCRDTFQRLLRTFCPEEDETP